MESYVYACHSRTFALFYMSSDLQNGDVVDNTVQCCYSDRQRMHDVFIKKIMIYRSKTSETTRL